MTRLHAQEHVDKAAQIALFHAYTVLRQTANLVSASARTDDTALQAALRRIENHLTAIRILGMRLEVLESIFALIFLRKRDVDGTADPAADTFLVSPRLCKRLLSLLKDAATTLEGQLGAALDEGDVCTGSSALHSAWHVLTARGLCLGAGMVQSAEHGKRLASLQACIVEALWRYQVVFADVTPATKVVSVRTLVHSFCQDAPTHVSVPLCLLHRPMPGRRRLHGPHDC